MRTAAKVDGNHGQILDALNKFPGMRAYSTAQLGKGKPDILAAFRGATVWLEVKQPGEKPNAAQVEFLASWPGKAYVVCDPDEAVRVVVEAARE